MIKKFFKVVPVMILLVLFILSIQPIFAGDIGIVYHTSVVTYINNYAIPSYNYNNNTYIRAEDLNEYGFDVLWDPAKQSLRIFRNPDKTISNPIKTFISNPNMIGYADFILRTTNVKVYINDYQKELTCYGGIEGYTLINVNDLICFGASIYWEPELNAVKIWLEDGLNFSDTMSQVEVSVDDLSKLRDLLTVELSGISGDWSLFVKNLSTGAAFSINNKQMKPASVIKLFNMVGAYDAINKGELALDGNVSSLLSQMITVSSNNASNELVRLVGQGSIKNGTQSVTERVQALGCTDTLAMTALYDVSGPAYGINRTTVENVGLLLEKIYRKQCISEEYDKQMLGLLLGQTKRNKIPSTLPPDILVANKTGETNRIEADAAIVFSPKCDYILCVISNNAPTYQAQKKIGAISKIVFDYLNQ